MTRKYQPLYYPRYLTYYLAPFIKSALFSALSILILSSILRIDLSSKMDLILIAIGWTFVEFSAGIVLFLRKKNASKEKPSFENTEAYKKVNQMMIRSSESLPSEAPPIDPYTVFGTMMSPEQQEIVGFIKKNVTSDKRSFGQCLIINKSEESGSAKKPGQFSLVLGMFRLNDVRRINRYLINCNEILLPGGWLVSNYQAMEMMKEDLWWNHHGLGMKFILLWEFLFHRAFPKIPRLNVLYFCFTKGKNRRLSKTEVWGRLHYCGFSILDEIQIGGKSFVISKKVNLPSSIKTPSYYPLVRLERVGLDGRIIEVHKIRTMYPFSEFLQKRIFEKNDMDSSGKFREDFRITSYGKRLRRYWLDELPGIIDWLHGDIKLVGIRAMSPHYFSLYPRNYQEIFVRVKPGLIPPIFDEGTKEFDQIVEIESEYLKKYLAHPWITDVQYFLRTLSEIIFKGVRSK